MATRAQAKTAIDSAGTTVKADIDNILPSGANIDDGSIRFNPLRYSITMIEANITAATTLATTITTNLTGQARPSIVGFSRRKADGSKFISITSGAATFRIQFS